MRVEVKSFSHLYKVLLLTIFIASNAFAQTTVIQNEANKIRQSSAVGVMNGISGDKYGNIFVSSANTTTSLGKAEDAPAVSGDTGVMCLGVRNDTQAAQTSNDGDYGAPAIDSAGHLRIVLDKVFTGSTTNVAAVLEDAPSNDGDMLYPIGVVRRDTPVSSSGTTGDYSTINTDANGNIWVRNTYPGTPTATQPSVTTATSFTILAVNSARRTLTIQNNSAANILISLTGAALTGIVPTATNIGLVLTPGSSYTSPPNYITTSAITCYQTSGGTINTVSVVEG